MGKKEESLTEALLRPLNPALIIILGGYTMLWGLWVIMPFWDVFTSAGIYSVLASLAPEAFWGAVALCAGAITTYGAVRRHYGPLVRGALTAFWHWLMISIFYFMGDPFNTGGITALMLAFYAACVYVNIRVNYKNSKHNNDILREIE